MNDKYDDLKIILWIILFLFFGIIIITCKSIGDEYIMTVNGPESPGKIGVMLEHEHILVDFIGADSTGYERWDRDSVIDRMIPYLKHLREKGVRTIAECTPVYLGRDPWLLRELSRRSGMIFITNTGYYGSQRNKFIPGSFFSESAESLADKWIDEFNEGIEGSGVKPGFIKIAVENDSVISPDHIKIVKAAGLAHLKTGLTIVSHTGPDHLAFGQLAILKELGIDPSAFIWVHAQRGTMEGLIEAAKMGTWISLDNIRNRPNIAGGSPNSIEWYADRISGLKKQNLLNRVLLSHDSGWYHPGLTNGGKISGYTDLFDYLLPELMKRGFTDDDIDMLLVRNPVNAFKIRIRKLN